MGFFGTKVPVEQVGEAVFHTSAGAMAESELKEYNAHRDERKQAEQERRKAIEAELAEKAALRRECPLMGGVNTDCIREGCALFADGCALARLAGGRVRRDTKGLRCMLQRRSGKCSEDCALYNGGCTLTAIHTTESKEEHKA